MSKKIIFFLVYIYYCASLIYSSNTSEIPGFRAAIISVTPIIEEAISSSISLFTSNKGGYLQKDLIFLNQNKHNLIDYVLIKQDYKVLIVFKQKFTNQPNTFIPYYLENKAIVFIPNIVTILNPILNNEIINNKTVLNLPDKIAYGIDFKPDNNTNKPEAAIKTTEKRIISSFNCLTNIDENISLNMGQSISIAGERSILAHFMKNEDSKYYGNCIYIKSPEFKEIVNKRSF